MSIKLIIQDIIEELSVRTQNILPSPIERIKFRFFHSMRKQCLLQTLQQPFNARALSYGSFDPQLLQLIQYNGYQWLWKCKVNVYDGILVSYLIESQFIHPGTLQRAILYIISRYFKSYKYLFPSKITNHAFQIVLFMFPLQASVTIVPWYHRWLAIHFICCETYNLWHNVGTNDIAP